MSITNQPNGSPVGEFQARFGTPPAAQDLKDACEKWERLCGQLLEERARLQRELADAQVENRANLKAIVALVFKDCEFNMTMEEVYAQVDRQTSIHQLIAELERRV